MQVTVRRHRGTCQCVRAGQFHSKTYFSQPHCHPVGVGVEPVEGSVVAIMLGFLPTTVKWWGRNFTIRDQNSTGGKGDQGMELNPRTDSVYIEDPGSDNR